MPTLKIAIALTEGFANRFEAQSLLYAFNSAKEFDASLLVLNHTTLYLEQNKVKVHIDCPTPDIILTREIFSLFKYFGLIANVLKQQNPKLLILDNNITRDGYIINKLKQGIALSQAGLPFPKSLYIPDFNTLMQSLDEYVNTLGGYPILLKHRSAGKGNSIYKLSNKTEFIQTIEKLIQDNGGNPSVIKKYYLQEFLKLKADYRILVIGRKIVGAMQRIPKAGEFRANFSLGGTTAPAQLTQTMRELTDKAISTLNLDFAGVDLVQTIDNQWYILEVNKTPGFEGFSKTYPDLNIPQLFADFVKEKARENRLI